MKIAVCANEDLKKELLAQDLQGSTLIEWSDDLKNLLKQTDAAVFIDLLFDGSMERINLLKSLLPRPVIVNSVITTADKLPEQFIRINGWNTFLKRAVIEVSGRDEKMKMQAEEIFARFNKKVEWVPDIPGFFSARIIAMIINEAYFALQEEVSSKEEIDTAMKLGTNYPYGPFDWSKKIGLKNVYELLVSLTQYNKSYEPAALLKKEALYK